MCDQRIMMPSSSARAAAAGSPAAIDGHETPSYAREDLLAAVRALAPRLRAASDEIEAGRSLTEPLVQALADAGFYRLYLPRSLGGGELDPLTYFDVIEALARVESAAGWSVLISTGAMTITARGLPDETLRAMFTSPRNTIMAGSGPPKGRAHAVPGGYRLTGSWTQGSNIRLAAWVLAGCHLYDGDRPRLGPDGAPLYLRCVLPASDVEIFDTWTTTGMRGTGSHDFAIDDKFIPEERVHRGLDVSRRPQPLYQFVGWTHVAHAALGLGIARVAIDEFIALAGGKSATWHATEGRLATRTTIQAKVAQAEALVGSGRAYVREATRDIWETVSRRETPSTSQRAVYRLAVAQAYANATQAVDLMYSLAGATAIYARSRLDRCLRDVHTAGAHVWVAPDTYELAGRLFLGLDPGSPNI
jgi:alkylation response protein AidB-like acyl-CoA dehydrogenase